MTLAQSRPDAQPGPSPELVEPAAVERAVVPATEGGAIVTEPDMPAAEAMAGETEKFDAELANKVARGLVDAYLGPARRRPVNTGVRAMAQRRSLEVGVARAMRSGGQDKKAENTGE